MSPCWTAGRLRVLRSIDIRACGTDRQAAKQSKLTKRWRIEQEALSTIKAWNAHPTMETAQLMGADKAATMMLAMRPPQRESLQEESKLCEKKDKIIALFDQLLAKLGGEELSANITMGKVGRVRVSVRHRVNLVPSSPI
jgi:hypothetical protein